MLTDGCRWLKTTGCENFDSMVTWYEKINVNLGSSYSSVGSTSIKKLWIQRKKMMQMPHIQVLLKNTVKLRVELILMIF